MMNKYDVSTHMRPIFKDGNITGFYCVGQVEAVTVEDALSEAKKKFPQIPHPMVQPHIRLTAVQKLASREELQSKSTGAVKQLKREFAGTKRVWR